MDEPVHSSVRRPLSRHTAQDIARLMGALSTASRVRILARLRVSPCAVGELSTELEMEQPAVSHQLRVLRDLGLVVGDRSGRSVVYGLFDSHVASLIDEALRHIDHVTAQGAGHTGDGAHSSHRRPSPSQGGDSMSTEHEHDAPHTHEHAHGAEVHDHPHASHEHAHVTHDHAHGEDDHGHEHVHQADLEDVHEHTHS